MSDLLPTDLVTRLRAVDANSFICREAADEIERLQKSLDEMTERKDAVNDTLRLVVEERNRLRETLALRDRENGVLADAYLEKVGVKPEDLR